MRKERNLIYLSEDRGQGREDNREIRTKQDGKMRGNSFNFRGQYIVGRAEDSI